MFGPAWPPFTGPPARGAAYLMPVRVRRTSPALGPDR
jgi:hypothetical protein